MLKDKFLGILEFSWILILYKYNLFKIFRLTFQPKGNLALAFAFVMIMVYLFKLTPCTFPLKLR
jgi:hypothetical protein